MSRAQHHEPADLPTRDGREQRRHGLEKKRATQRYDFGRLKQLVGVAQVLTYYSLDGGLRYVRGELRGPCPLPEHQGDRNNRWAFCANPSKAVWRCFSSCGGGDVVDLIRRAGQLDFAQAARVLAHLADATWPQLQTAPQTSGGAQAHAAVFTPYTRQLHLEPDHPFLRAKHILPDVAARFEAGAWAYRGFLDGCIGVRLHDPDGRPLGYAGRRIANDDIAKHGKWKLPPRFPKASLLFGYHRARPHLARSAIVVEGPFDAMRVHQAGHLNVVALLGTQISPAQLALLAPIPRIDLLLDGDRAGRAAGRRAALAIEPQRLHVVDLREGVGPADLDDHELRTVLARALSLPG